MKKKVFIGVFITVIIFSLSIAWHSNFIAKIKNIGNNPSEAIFYLIQILKKDGLINTITRVQNKLSADPRLGLGYSLSDLTQHPSVESEDDRRQLPEYLVIPGADTSALPSSSSIHSKHEDWHRSNGGNTSGKYSSLTQINNNNAKNLELAWSYSSSPHSLGESEAYGRLPIQTNPIMVRDRLFLASINSELMSINALDGKDVWKTKLPPPVARRGLVWEPNSDFNKSRLFVPTGGGVYAVNANSGEIIEGYGNKGQVGNQMSLIAPIIADDKLIVALIKPSIEAYSLKDGKLLWSRSLLEKQSGGDFLLTGGVPWSGMSYDPVRKRIYVSTGNARPELWGTSRPGPNKHTNSIVSIDANSGNISWAFQEVEHDLWDLDIAGIPILATIDKNGRPIDVVVTPSKTGNVIVLDRDFGKPIFDYRKKRAPTSKIPGEQTAKYQPLLEFPEPLLKQSFELSDITDLSESASQSVRRTIHGAKMGFYEPPILGGKVILFGIGGGASWPGGAIDPTSNTLFVPTNNNAWIIRANYRDLKGAQREISKIDGDNIYQNLCASCHGVTRDGIQEKEFKGGNYNPSLIGITFLRTQEYLMSSKIFQSNHEGINLNNKPTNDNLAKLYEYFSSQDSIADKDKSIAARTFWMPLLDDNGNPGNKPPWGFLSAINLTTGKKIWSIPLGEYNNLFRNGEKVKGQVNYGGALATAGEVVFVTGTTDKNLRAFDSKTGKELWSFQLPFPGSAPPMTYFLDGVQYIVVVAGEKKWESNKPMYDRVLAFRLPKK